VNAPRLGFYRVQIVYRQSLVRDFVAHGDIKLVDFYRRIKAIGRVKTIREPQPIADLNLEDVSTAVVLYDSEPGA
jgi:hypothetical protein